MEVGLVAADPAREVVSAEAAVGSAAVELREIGKMINAETFFTAEEQERIRQAVVSAEQQTAGEIVPMLVSASARYVEVELAGMAVGLVVGTLAAFVCVSFR